MAKWKKFSTPNIDELVNFLEKNNLTIGKVETILQDSMGIWHVFYRS